MSAHPVASLLCLLLSLVLSPLLLGVINRVKAKVGGRRGRPLLQVYFDIAKLLRKNSVYPKTTTWFFRAAPIAGVATALLALLLLRGPQTVGELFARSERLHRFADAEEVRHQLERLCTREPALALQLPRGPGQREDRYVHLLCGPVDVQALAAAARSTAPLPADTSALEARVAELETQVAQLQQQLEDVLTRLG